VREGKRNKARERERGLRVAMGGRNANGKDRGECGSLGGRVREFSVRIREREDFGPG